MNAFSFFIHWSLYCGLCTGTIKQYVYQGDKARNLLIKRYSRLADWPKRDNCLCSCGHERTTIFQPRMITESGSLKVSVHQHSIFVRSGLLT